MLYNKNLTVYNLSVHLTRLLLFSLPLAVKVDRIKTTRSLIVWYTSIIAVHISNTNKIENSRYLLFN